MDFLEVVEVLVEVVQAVVGRILIFLWVLFVFLSCDRRKTIEDYLPNLLECYVFGTCSTGSRYGMIGDSWTDAFLGIEVEQDLFDQLTKRYRYKIVASNVGGLSLKEELEWRRGFISVIKNAGPELEYMLLSIGGNDIIFPISEFQTHGVENTIKKRLDQFEEDLKTLMVLGNQLKFTLYQGKPLKWIIHGYDFPNPEIEESCILNAVEKGMPKEEAINLISRILNEFNQRLEVLSKTTLNLYYIDLRGTLGGPPISKKEFMLDCLHPNTLGFQLLTDRYVQQLQFIEKNL
ncbi:MAG: SGNH/GDSL hydrolase family protein [Leptospiraceae bacterium]|nr:SGNH/GDSL hydrolase family protein [Leptospiraceae bacterium]